MQPTCSHDCRLVPILPDLWLCDHAAYGRMVNLRGAVDLGRQMLERYGGYQKMRDDLDRMAKAQKEARELARKEGLERVRRGVREGV